MPNIDTVQLWMLTVIGGTVVALFVIVALITILSVLGLIKLPANVARSLHAVMIVEVAVVAVGAATALISPDAIANLLKSSERLGAERVAPASAASAEGTATDLPIPASTAADLAALSCAGDDTTPLLYVHFGTESQRALAQQAQTAASSLGLYAPGIELRPEYTSGETQLRYFHQNEAEDAAEVLGALSARVALPNPALRQVPLDARPCQFELWIGAEG